MAGLTGRIGSLLGAFLFPDQMVEGSPDTSPPTTTGTGSTPGGNNPPPLAKKGKITDAQVAGYALAAGLSGTGNAIIISVAICIAECGGSPRTDAIGPLGEIGLWQIYPKAHPNYNKTKLLDPSYNAMAMFQVSSGGTNWHPWTTFENGSYQQYMSRAKTAVGNVGGLFR